MINSAIQWTDHTWNIARGCTKVDEDCLYCYMYRQSLNGTRYEPKQVTRTKTVFNLPLKVKEPSKFFTSSLTDWAHVKIDPYRHEMWDIIRACPHHTFQLLTKRPERLHEVLPLDWGMGYKNVWLGTSVGNDKAIERIEELCRHEAVVRFLSLEPLWTKLDDIIPIDWADGSPCINWVIVGGESGNDNGQYRYRECKIEWIESIIQQCRDARVPVFVKQLGTHLAKQLKLSDRHGGNIEEWPERLRMREMPEVKHG
jgi:protein gp37